MANGPYFGHVVTAMVTPFDEELRVDEHAAAKLCSYLLENGSDSLVVCGTTGESATLSHDEKLRMFRIAKKVTEAGCGMVIAGTGSNNTSETIALTKAAEEVGVDAVLLVAPYYSKPSQEGMYQHFAAVATSTKLPVILYNVPGRTSSNILPATVQRLATDIPNIVAVKEASSDLLQVATIAAGCKRSFEIYSGDDNVNLPILSVGGVGAISVISHVAGNELRRMHEAFFCGEFETARNLHLATLPLTKALFCTSNPVPVKYAMESFGVIPSGRVRLPLVEANEAERKQIDDAIAAYRAPASS